MAHLVNLVLWITLTDPRVCCDRQPTLAGSRAALPAPRLALPAPWLALPAPWLAPPPRQDKRAHDVAVRVYHVLNISLFFHRLLCLHLKNKNSCLLRYVGNGIGKYGDRSTRFCWAPCAQLYSLAETPQPPIWAHIRWRYWSAKIDDMSL
jgi:hypothetical protein